MQTPQTHYKLRPLRKDKDAVCSDGPNKFERQCTADLEAFITTHASPGPPCRQLAAIKTLQDIFRDWCGCGEFHMFISGSYKMNVHTKEADIDVVFVTTSAISRTAVFDGFLRALELSDAVTAITAIPNARVPLICATVDGQEFDIMTCHLRGTRLPPREAMLDAYVWMNGLDEASILAFNGPRITTVVLAAVPKPRHFLTAVRFLRLWAKQRAIYSNKSGYLGGINIVLLVAYAALQNPRAVASTLVAKTVELVAKWNWGNREPLVAFLEHGDPELPLAAAAAAAAGGAAVSQQCPVWLRAYDMKAGEKDAVTILTPCYPRFNTMHAASDYSVKTLAFEFARAHELITSMQSLAKMDYTAIASALPVASMCRRFLKVSVSVPSSRRGMAWQGFVESQTRFLLKYLAQEELAIANFRFIPIWVSSKTDTHCVREAYVTADDDAKIRTYAVKGDIHRAFQYFMETHACAGPPQPTGSAMTLAFVGVADLPVASLVADMLTFDAAAPVTYSLPPPIPASSSSSSSSSVASGEERDAQQGPAMRVLNGGTKPVLTANTNIGPKKRLRIMPATSSPAAPCLQRYKMRCILAAAAHHKKRKPAPVPAPVPGTIVRPRRVDGVDVTPEFDVYIGHEWRRGGWSFAESATLLGAPEASSYPDRGAWLVAYEYFARSKIKTDAGFNAVVASLHGKTLACWCIAAEHCHGSILLRLASETEQPHVHKASIPKSNSSRRRAVRRNKIKAIG